MGSYKTGGHTVWYCKYHLVWVTKLPYHVWGENVRQRCRELICHMARGLEIVLYVSSVNRDQVDLWISVPPSLSVSWVVQYLEGGGYHELQSELEILRKSYLCLQLWARSYWDCRSWQRKGRA